MKNFFFAFILLFSFSALSGVSILSDLDDTIKITVGDGDATDIIGSDVYTGMPEFFMGAKDYSNSLYILSASPAFMRPIIVNTLKKRKIQYKGLVLRSRLSEGKFKYKVKEIKKILAATSDDFIFIGDDLGKDPEVYAEIKRLFPGRVLAIYIHIVNGRKIEEDVVPYWMSFDLFLREYLEGRMSPGWLEMGWNKLLSETNLSLIFPKKAQCPNSSTVWEWQNRTVFQQEAFQLVTKLVEFCQQR